MSAIEFKYAIGDEVYLIGYVGGETKICECCGQEYETECVPHKVVKGTISARKFVEDEDGEHWEKSGIYYRLCTDKRNGKPLWFRPNMLEQDLFDTEEQAQIRLDELRK